MSIDLPAARRFIHANARLLETLRAGVLLDGAPATGVTRALRAYQNSDGGLGHALEPDVRTPHSETTAALHGLDVLAEVGALDDPMVAEVAGWVGSVAPDGGVPFVLPAATDYPHGPWMVPAPSGTSGDAGSHLTFGLAGVLSTASVDGGWLPRATTWCWQRLEQPAELGGYLLKFALAFLDATPEEDRAFGVIEQLRPLLRADGSVAVPGGTEDEQLTALTLSPRPHLRSRVLFTDEQVEAGLDEIEAGQQDDGGWTVDFLDWCPGQALDWRGIATFDALATLRAHHRL